jgi:hypothetical protein
MSSNFSSFPWKTALSWGWPVIAAWVLVNILKTLPTVHITRPGTASVVFNAFAGLQQRRVLLPGATPLTPGVERAIPYVVRTQVLEFSDLKNEQVISNPLTAIAADGQSFTINVNIALRLNPDTLDDLHAQIGEDYIRVRVTPLVRSKFRDVAAKFQSEDFYRRDRRLEVEKQAKELIEAELPRTQRDGKEVPFMYLEWVYIETADFPPALRESIEKKQVAGILAQTAGVRAQIQQKETNRVLILAKANERAIELKGQAALLGGPLADLLFYERINERLSNAKQKQQPMPIKVIRVEGNATVFLNVDPQKVPVISRPAQ